VSVPEALIGYLRAPLKDLVEGLKPRKQASGRGSAAWPAAPI